MAARRREAEEVTRRRRPAPAPATPKRGSKKSAKKKAKKRSKEERARQEALERRRARDRARREEAKRLAALEEQKRLERNKKRRAARAEAKRLAELEEQKRLERNARRRQQRKEKKLAEERAFLEAERAAIQAEQPEATPSQRRRERVEQIAPSWAEALSAIRDKLESDEKRRTREYGYDVARAARRMEEVLQFVAYKLEQGEWRSKVSVHANADKTVDGDLSVEIAPDQATLTQLCGMGGLVSTLEDHLALLHDRLPGAWMQWGFYLPSESQVTRRSDNRRSYKIYQHALRFGYNYQKVKKEEGVLVDTAQHARDTIQGILEKHERPLAGMYVRVFWAKDGELRRQR